MRFNLTESFSCLSNVTFVCKDNINYMTVDETIDLLNSLSMKIEQLESKLSDKEDLIKLIADAYSFNKQNSVKEILRDEIKGIDTVTTDSACAWHDYCILSNFFEEQYQEFWDND